MMFPPNLIKYVGWFGSLKRQVDTSWCKGVSCKWGEGWIILCLKIITPLIFFFWRNSPQWTRASSFSRCLDHTQRRITVGRIPLDEWSARRRDLYLTSHNTHNRDIHAPGGIRTRSLNRRAAADLRLRPRGHWDRQSVDYWYLFMLIGTVPASQKTPLPCYKNQYISYV